MLKINIENKKEFKYIGNEVVNLIIEIVSKRKNEWFVRKKEKKLNQTNKEKREIEAFLNSLTPQYIEELVFLKPEKLRQNALNFASEKRSEALNDFIKSIFNVTYKDHFPRRRFIQAIGLKTCPYCNRAYIYTIEEGEINPQIDHFYYKAKYPLFAVSLYNLIPACSVCNSAGAKGQRDTLLGYYSTHSPHETEDSEFRFNYKLLSPAIIKGSKRLTGNDVQILLDSKNEVYDKLFHITSLYEQHVDHIVDLLYKRKFVYNNETLEFLRRLTGKNLKRSTLDRFIVGAYVEVNNYHKRPLSKLYTEIAKEIELIPK